MHRLVMAAQALAVLLGATVGAHQVPLSLLVIALVGVALLVPVAARVAAVLAVVWHRPTGLVRHREVPDFVVPPAPGTPGTALARAPSRGVLAAA
jgi:hypothetical protein